MKKISLIIISAFILSGCFSENMLKKSANNKLIDRKGFHGSKRRPLYNKKYIEKAKHNIAKGDFEEDEYDDEERYLENLPAPLKNRYIYEDMIEEDIKAERAKRAKKKLRYFGRLRDHEDEYPDIGRGRDRVREARRAEEQEDLKRELKEIKGMLDAAREDLVKYRCPIDDEGKPTPKVKHEVKPVAPKKIHEEVKNEEKAKIAPAPASKKTEKPKAKPAAPKKPATHSIPKPVSKPVVKPAPIMHKAQENIAKSIPEKVLPTAPNPEPVPVAPKAPEFIPEAKRAEQHNDHTKEEHHHNGNADHSHTHEDGITNIDEPDEVISFPSQETDSIKPIENSNNMQTTIPVKPEIQEFSKPQLTEIPSVPEDDEVSSEAPELPSFP